MDQVLETQKRETKLTFNGEGSSLFGLMMYNYILMLLTCGIYYPWAKAAKLKFLYAATELAGSRFEFHGTGEELFKGYLKVMGFFILLMLSSAGIAFTGIPYMANVIPLIAYVFIILIAPLAIHGTIRYRTSRSSWRNIHFGYRGIRSELFKGFLVHVLYTVLTIGIYSSWLVIYLRTYIINNIRFGNIRFRYTGTGMEYFKINLIGIMLTIITLGIYSFWYAKERFNYYVSKIYVIQGDNKYLLISHAEPGKIFNLWVINFLLLFFTFGMAYPWIIIRNLRFVFDNTSISPDFDVNSITQTEDEYTDASGDDLLDMLDIDLV